MTDPKHGHSHGHSHARGHGHGHAHSHTHAHGHGHGHAHGHKPAVTRAPKASRLDPDQGLGPLSTLDPRVKLACALAVSLATAACRTVQGGAALCVLGLVLTLFSGVSVRRALTRAAAVNVFTAFMWVFLLWRIEPGPDGLGLAYHPEALSLGLLVTLKINAVFLCLLACLGSTRLDGVLHAMAHMNMPPRLVAVFFLFHRYVHVVHGEYVRLRSAMRVRCFRPRFDAHTYRSVAWLLGMILVRAYDRAERVYAAMLCRGFSGTFWLMEHFHWRRRDTAFCMAVFAALAAALVLDLESAWRF